MLRGKWARTAEYQHKRIIGYAGSWRATWDMVCAEVAPDRIHRVQKRNKGTGTELIYGGW